MEKRQKKLIKLLIDSHIKTAQPIASNFLVKKLKNAVSSATVRNEMVELEKKGLILQPHTSAGRIPTEKGYKFYVENFLKEKSLSGKRLTELKKKKQLIVKDNRKGLKELAKYLAEMSGEAVIVAFDNNDTYYTGLSNLFAKPEFEEKQLICQLGCVLDQLDKAIYKIFDKKMNLKEVEIKIGRDNIFSDSCSSMMIPHQKALITILGPMRMNYEDNSALLNDIKE